MQFEEKRVNLPAPVELTPSLGTTAKRTTILTGSNEKRIRTPTLKTVIGLLVFSLALDNSSDKESAIGGGANGSTSH